MMNNWYVVKTKPKQEEEVTKRLQTVPYEVFLPRMKGISVSTKPLFPSYLFIRTDFREPCHHRMVRFTRGVHKILGDEEGPQPVSQIIVDTLRERTIDGSLIEQDLLFKDGDGVRIKRGILKDLCGIIEKNISDSGRVKILFKWLNSSMRAVLKYTDIEKT